MHKSTPDRASMHPGSNFSFYVPMTAFEKADAEEGKQRRVAGIISTESRDLQGEVVLQRGLDFAYFLKNGWLNNNHKSEMADVLGFPTSVKTYAKGQELPDGSTADGPLTWSEGYLLQTKAADEVWELARALANTNRRLGFSIEGQILQRQGADRKTISKAEIRHVALTHVPVNTDSRLETLLRSLSVQDGVKALSAGSETYVVPGRPYSGEGAGALLLPESLEGAPRPGKRKKRRPQATKSMSQHEAVAWCRSHIPGCDQVTARQFVHFTDALIRCSLIEP